VRKWDEIEAIDGDTAVRNSGGGAEFLGYVSMVRMEAASTMGRHVVESFFDLSKFYDTIQPDELVQDVKSTAFPPLQAALSMQANLCPRAFSVDGAFSMPIQTVGRSIVAGCSNSPSFS